MFLVCPDCLRASNGARPQEHTFECPFCRYEWAAPNAEARCAYFCDVGLLRGELHSDIYTYSIQELPCTLGRDSDFMALQSNLAVSRKHFTINYDASKSDFTITDLGSKGGTYLNGARLPQGEATALTPGDNMIVSGVNMKFLLRFNVTQPRIETKPLPEPLSLSPRQGIWQVGGENGGTDLYIPDSGLLAFIYRQENNWRIISIDKKRCSINGERFVDRTLESGDEVVFAGYSALYDKGGERLALLDAGSVPSIRVEDICYSIKKDTDRLTILNNVSIEIPPGKLTGIIGPSGCGKTTLMRIIAGLKTPDKGSFTLGVDERLTYGRYCELLPKITIVPQDDIIRQELTIEDTMKFQASLRLRQSVSPEDMAQRIEKILDDLEIAQHRTKKISDLSGGQRKRVSVAVELLSSPSILFLDEPTTGLDAGTERSLVQSLKKLARQGRSVIMITHSMGILQLLDSIIFMRESNTGGEVLAAGSPRQILQERNINNWADLFPEKTHKANTSKISHPNLAALNVPGQLTNSPKTFVLFLRYLKTWLMTPWTSILTLFGLPMFLGLLIRVALPTDSTHIGADRILLGTICVFWLGLNQSVREIVKEKRIFLHEAVIGVSPFSYLLSKSTFFLIVGFFQAVLVVLPIVFLRVSASGISPEDTLSLPKPYLFLSFWLVGIVGSGVGLFISSICTFLREKGEILATFLVILVTLPQILFSSKIMGGELVNTDNAFEQYRTFGLFKDALSERIPEFLSYFTVTRYGGLPLSALANGAKGSILTKIIFFNSGILVMALLILFVLSWIMLVLNISLSKRTN